ncbi:hypothetical protein CYY_006109 [Polysphondylium violaceum]|uniref:Uncharacterized protein n=1 Tax=Polysphondylium violaceum TaxID=133409 RepID=A0A8J4URQ7_9MYCE|nr:hypothetical protein CYY_006109 [Polysphondylium violaceum]
MTSTPPSSQTLVWDLHCKSFLLEALGKYLPLGINKNFSIINCLVLLQERFPDKQFTYEIVNKEISEFYNLDEVDDDIIDEDKQISFELPDEYKSMMDEKLSKTKKAKV